MPSLAAIARTNLARRARLKVRRHAVAAAVLAVALQPGANALPQGGVPTFGQTQVSTQGAQMTIVQGSNRAGIDWRSFSLGNGEGLNIVQPSASSILVNRVIGTDPSVILGNLSANGRVFLSNPRGVVFGKGSMVDVGSLVATTLNLSDAAMLAGRLDLQAAEITPGELTQDGNIVAAGTVALVAPRLMQSGTIQAPRIGLAAAERVSVDVEGDGLIFFNVGTSNLDVRLRQLGRLQADGGLAEIRAQARGSFADTVLNLDGIVQARGVASRGGRIFVDGGTAGVTDVRGTLDASSSAVGVTGGAVTVLGDKVGLFDNAVLIASGLAGGGQVLVGGNWQGKGPERNAQMTYVGADVRIDASAIQSGDGGTVVVWADQHTQFYGAADARAGAARGDGGFVEVSGKATLDYRGTSDRSAPQGRHGVLLLDPTNLTINNATNANLDPSPPPSTFRPLQDTADGTSILTWGTLLGALVGGPVTVTTVGSADNDTDTGTIRIAATPAGYNSANALTLTTAAAGSVVFEAAVTNAGSGALNLNAGTGGVQFNAALSLTTGGLTVNSTGPVSQTAALTVGGATSITAGANAITLGNAANSLTGAVSLNNSGANNVSLVNNRATVLGTSSVGSGTLSVSSNAAGSITQTGAVTQAAGAGAVTFSAGANVITLNLPGNDFTGPVSLSNSGANSVTLVDANSLTLGAVGIGSGTNLITATAAGSTLTRGAALTVGAAPTLSVGGQAVNAGLTGYFVSGVASSVAVQEASGLLNVSAAGAAALPAMTVSGDFTVSSASGAITQAGALNVGGATSVTAGANAITLGNAANSLTGAVSLNNSGANNVSLVNNRATVLGTSSVGSGTLSVSSNAAGAITQTGAVTQAAGAGAVTFSAGANAITLGNAGNDFTGAVGVANTGANDVALRDANAIVLGASTVGQNLTVTSGGNVTQSGALVVGGTTGITAGANAITLGNAANSLTGAVSLNNSGANNVSLVNNRATVLGTSSVGSGTLSVSSNAAGAITQTGAVTQAAGGGAVTFSAGANAITLGNAGNDFIGAVGVANTGANDVALRDANAIVLSASTVGQNLDVTSGGNVTQSGALVVGGTTSITAGANAITLGNAANSLTGAVSLNNSGANNVSLVNNRATVLGTSSVGSGTLSVSSNAAGAITQTGAVTQAAGGGAVTFSAGANAITLGNAGNDFTGAVVVANTGANDVALRDANAIVLGASTVGQNFSVTAAGSISQTGALVVGGALGLSIDVAQNQDVLLATSDNNIAGAVTVSVTGGATLQDVGLRNVNAAAALPGLPASLRNLDVQFTEAQVVLPDVVLTGTLNVLSKGNITQAANGLKVTGASTLTVTQPASNITLTGSNNEFSSVVLSKAGSGTMAAVSVNDKDSNPPTTGNGLSIGGAGTTLADTDLSVTAGGAVTFTGGLLKSLVATSGSHIGQTGALNVGGATNLTVHVGTNKDLLLSGFENDFAGTVTIAATGAGSFRDIGLRNRNATPSLTGLPSSMRDLTLIYDQAGIALPTLSLNGNLRLEAGGPVSQVAPTDALNIAGTSSVLLTAFSGSVGQGPFSTTLSNSSNDFVGPLSVASRGAASIRDHNDLSVTFTTTSATTAIALGHLDAALGGTGGTFLAGASISTGGTSFSLATDTGGTTHFRQSDVSTSLTVNSGDEVSQSGRVQAQTAQLNGNGEFKLTRADNSLPLIAIGAGSGDVSLVTQAELEVGEVTRDQSAIWLRTLSANLSLSSNVSALSLGLDAAGSVVQTGGVITAGTLGARAGGSVLLGSTNAVGTFTANAGGDVLFREADGYGIGSLGDSALNVAGGAANGTAVYRGTTGIVAGGTETIELNTVAGAVTQTADLTAQNLVLRGAAAYELTRSGNSVSKLAADSGAGTVHYVNAGALELANVGTAELPSGVALPAGKAIERTGDVWVRALVGNLTLSAAADVGASKLGLDAAGSVVQTGGVITAGTLGARAGGSVLLGSTNAVGTFTANAGGDVLFREADGYGIGSLSDSALNVAGGAANGTAVYRGTTGIVAGGTETIELNTVAGAVTQTADLTAQNLVLRGAAAYELTRSGNSVSKLAADSGAGTVHYVNAGALELANVGTAELPSGVALPAGKAIERTGDVWVRALVGNLTLSAAADVGASKLGLDAAGSVVQTGGVITAGTLGARAGGSVLLGSTNAVGTFTANAGGDVLFREADGYGIGSLGDSALNVAGGAANGTAVYRGTTGIVAGGTETIELNTVAGAVTQTADLTAQNLVLRGAAAYELTRSGNSVSKLAADSGAGTVHYVNAGALELANVGTAELPSGVALPAGKAIERTGDVWVKALVGNLTLSAAADVGASKLGLDAAGSVVQTGGVITAGTLGARAGGSVLLGSTNAVGTFTANAGGDVLFREADGYGIGSLGDSALNVAGGAANGTAVYRGTTGIVAGGTETIELNTVAGAVTQTADLTAQNLVLRGAAAYELTRSGNSVSKLAADSGAGTVHYVNAGALELANVGTAELPSGVALPAGKAIERTGDVWVKALVGNLTLSAAADVGASKLGLDAAGSVVQTGGVITAGTLGARAGGSVLLGSTNAVGTFTANAGGDVLFREADGYGIGSLGDSALNVAGGAANGTAVYRGTTGIVAGGTETIELNTVAGAVTQTADLTAQNLVLRGAAAYELTRSGNSVSKLAADSGAGTVHYVNAGALELANVGTAELPSGVALPAGKAIERTGDVWVRALVGNLTLSAAADVGASKLGLDAAGSVVQTGGVITAGTLGARAGGSVLLGSTNAVGTFTANAGGDVLFREADGYGIGSLGDSALNVVSVPSSAAPDGTAVYRGTTGITAGNTNSIELHTLGGTVNQGAVLKGQTGAAQNLLLRGAANLDLSSAGNSVTHLAVAEGAANGNLAFRNEGDLTLKPLTGVEGFAYKGLDSLGVVNITAGGSITFQGSFEASGGSSSVFTLTSLMAPAADTSAFGEETAYVKGVKVQGAVDQLFSSTGLVVDLETGQVGTGASKLEVAGAVIKQAADSTVELKNNVTLRLVSAPELLTRTTDTVQGKGGGSIVLDNAGNKLDGGFIAARSASSKAAPGQSDFELDSTENGALPLLSRVVIVGADKVQIGDSSKTISIPPNPDVTDPYNSGQPAVVGIEADLVRLTAKTVSMQTSDRPADGEHIVARYSATRLVQPAKFEFQIPGLVLEMSPGANNFGEAGSQADRAAAAIGSGPGLKAVVGYSTVETRLQGSVGWVLSVPGLYRTGDGDARTRLTALLQANRAISLSGPVAKGLYSFASPEPVDRVGFFYNLEAPLTPGQRDALSAIDTLAEKLRREQIERSVSTENVAKDLREGVIVEVGAGPAATTGSEGIRLPQICPPASGGLTCSAPGKK